MTQRARHEKWMSQCHTQCNQKNLDNILGFPFKSEVKKKEYIVHTYCNLFQPPPISYSSSSPVRKMIEEYVLFCITMVFLLRTQIAHKKCSIMVKAYLGCSLQRALVFPLLSCLLQWLWWWAQKKPQSAKFALLRSNQIPIWTWLELRGEVYLTPRMTLDAFGRNFSWYCILSSHFYHFMSLQLQLK